MLWVPFIKYLSSEVYIYLQSVQAYISPPIAAVFLVGVFWPRANRFGAIASLVVGAVLGAARFLFEFNRGSARWSRAHRFLTSLVTINFLHFADPAVRRQPRDSGRGVRSPPRRSRWPKLRGLTFATLDEDVPARRRRSHRSVFTMQIVATVALALFTIGLWVHFA